MRIALVGISPANQITIKGYLRVLLRLDVELTWVSATEGSVDLFMVNGEFEQAPSVVKLLSAHPKTPVLYVIHQETGNGALVGNRLTLPLKDIQLLYRWLKQTVELLQQIDGQTDAALPKIPTPSTTNPATPTAHQENHTAITTQSSPQPSTLKPSSATSSAHSSGALFADLQSLVSLIETLSVRSNSTFEIMDEDTVVAVIDAKHQLLWQMADAPKLGRAWRLRLYNGKLPKERVPVDSCDWLWRMAWQQAPTLLALIDDHSKHQLRHWIKPSKQDRKELLHIMTVMEQAPISTTEIAQKTGIALLTVRKMVAALLFAGVLTPNSYKAPIATPMPKADIVAPPPEPVVQSPAPERQQKMSFLSKLRQKLGL